MPLPFILIGIGVLSSLYGGKKTIDAVSNSSSTKEFEKQARNVFNVEENALKFARNNTTKTLENLGELKLSVWSNQMGRFVKQFKRLKDTELTGNVELGDLKEINDELVEMENISLKASEVLTGGVAAVGTGALVGMASYGGAMMFASASTGTAIASLSGAAAANATMAWLGGGALSSAGGLGIAGGIYVLGGLVAGPVLAVGGAILASNAEKNLVLAKSNLAKARRAAEEMKNAKAIVKGIGQIGNEFRLVIDKMKDRMDTILNDFESLLDKHPSFNGDVQYSKLSPEEKQQVHLTVQVAQVMKMLLETALLTNDGAINKGSYKTLKYTKNILETSKT